MSTGKVVLRKCQGCNKIIERNLMFRITKNFSTNEIVLNPKSTIVGRSVYVCKNEACIKNLIKRKRIFKGLKVKNEAFVRVVEEELGGIIAL